MCICIVCICGASSFSYRSMQHISTWLSSQGNHPSQFKHCSCRPDRMATQFSHHRKELISLSLLQGGSTAMPAGTILSYHHHCCREGVLLCWQVPLSHIIVIAAGKEYCHADRCHSLISSSLLQGRSTAMLTGATLSYHCHCCYMEGVLTC